MTKSLLLVEDDSSLGQTIQERLQKEGYEVQWVQSAAQAQKVLSEKNWALVILDLGLPDGHGFELAEKIKRAPVLFMTAMNTAENRLRGFEMGAEEFLPKPFHLKELLLRVKHVLEKHPHTSEYQFGDVFFSLDRRTVRVARRQEEDLSSKDFEVLKLLCQASPKVVSRDEILNSAWGEDKYPTTRTVDNAIVRIRKLINDPNGDIIKSVRGVGYQLLLNKGVENE